jgi:hypothetical protein
MSSSFFTNLRDGMALTLLTRFGDDMRITKSDNVTYDPETGSVTTSTVSQDVKGKSFSRGDGFDTGEMVSMGDEEIYVAASGLSFAPQAGMSIKYPTTASSGLQIISAFPIPKSGTVVLYRLLAKR